MENKQWRKCIKCDAMTTPMFSKKFCFEHLTEELIKELPAGCQPIHIQLILNAVTNHYYPMKHKPRLDEHLKKEWNKDDKENILTEEPKDGVIS